MNWERVNEIIDGHIIDHNGRPTEAELEESVLYSAEGIQAFEVMNMMNEVGYRLQKSGKTGANDILLKTVSQRYPYISQGNLRKIGKYFAHAYH